MQPDRIRVLLVIEATIGGTKRHALTLATGLDPSRFDVTVACPLVRAEAQGDTSFVPELRAAGIPVYPVPMVRAIRPFQDLRAAIILSRFLSKQNPDIIHTHSSKAGMVGRVVGRLSSRAKIVHTPHGFYFLDRSGLSRRLFLWLEQAAGRLTDCLIAVSDSERQVAVQHGIIAPERIVVIENGIDLEAVRGNGYARLSRQDLGIPAGVPLVGTVARFIPQKAPEDTLAAFAHLHRAVPEAHLLWVGHSGEAQAQMRAEAERRGLGPYIHFLGYRPDALDLMRLVDVFLLTSRWEGMPLVVLEAMALSKPVVATAAVGTRDVVAHGVTGLLAPVGDPVKIAHHIEQLLRDPALAARLGNAAAQMVAERYAQQRMVARTEELYLRLLQRGGACA